MGFNMLTQEKIESLLRNAPEHLKYKERITALDFETPNRYSDRACSIGLTVIEREKITESVEFLINPEEDFDWQCIRVHGINPEDVEDAPTFDVLWPEIEDYFTADLVIAHNAPFDLLVLKRLFKAYGIEHDPVMCADTVTISRNVYGSLMPNHKLGTLCRELGIELDAHHAGSDSYGCAALYLRMLARDGDLSRFERQYSFD